MDDLDVTPKHFAFYPIEKDEWSFRRWDGTDVDPSTVVPFEIGEGVFIEDVSGLFREGEFDIFNDPIGSRRVQPLKRIKYGIIHRFPEYERDPETGALLLSTDLIGKSRRLVNEIAACLRLIRPVSQYTQFCEGRIAGDGKMYDVAFNTPLEVLFAPINHRQFRVRTEDLIALRAHAPHFRSAMAGAYWKFRMAAQMHEAGHFQNSDWKARYFLWTAALESLYTTQTPENSGSAVAKERIKFVLGAQTSIYPPGDLLSFVPEPGLTVADVVDDIYCLRNNIAHGDKVPDYYLEHEGRPDFEDGKLSRVDTLMEAISFLVRHSLLRIMGGGLLDHFKDAASSEAYFGGLGLTRTKIGKQPRKPCPL